MALLRPLLLDTVPTVQQTAAIALGRLAQAKDELAAAIVTGDILPQLVYSLAEQNRCTHWKFFKKRERERERETFFPLDGEAVAHDSVLDITRKPLHSC